MWPCVYTLTRLSKKIKGKIVTCARTLFEWWNVSDANDESSLPVRFSNRRFVIGIYVATVSAINAKLWCLLTMPSERGLNEHPQIHIWRICLQFYSTISYISSFSEPFSIWNVKKQDKIIRIRCIYIWFKKNKIIFWKFSRFSGTKLGVWNRTKTLQYFLFDLLASRCESFWAKRSSFWKRRVLVFTVRGSRINSGWRERDG